MKIILLICIAIFAVAGVVVLFVVVSNRVNEEVVLRVAIFPRSQGDYSLYHEVSLNVRNGQARMTSFEGLRRAEQVNENLWRALEYENIESRGAFLERTRRRGRVTLTESEFQNLMELAQTLEESNHEYVRSTALGSSQWRFIVLHNDVEYRMDRFAEGEFDEMKALIEKIIELSPIEMHPRFGPVAFPK